MESASPSPKIVFYLPASLDLLEAFKALETLTLLITLAL